MPVLWILVYVVSLVGIVSYNVKTESSPGEFKLHTIESKEVKFHPYDITYTNLTTINPKSPIKKEETKVIKKVKIVKKVEPKVAPKLETRVTVATKEEPPAVKDGDDKKLANNDYIKDDYIKDDYDKEYGTGGAPSESSETLDKNDKSQDVEKEQEPTHTELISNINRLERKIANQEEYIQYLNKWGIDSVSREAELSQTNNFLRNQLSLKSLERTNE